MTKSVAAGHYWKKMKKQYVGVFEGILFCVLAGKLFAITLIT
jgi:hypothetical protein